MILKQPKVIFVIGVSGSGKTTIGQKLAGELQVEYVDADDHHPEKNIEKMKSGSPLTDEDRLPWLDRLREIAKTHLIKGCVISCSALKQSYRDRLSRSIKDNIQWIYLDGNYELIHSRMKKRENHFMDANMLKSQFETLEKPTNALKVDINKSPDKIVQKILTRIR